MKELTIEEKAKRYDEASKWMEGIYPTLTHEQQMEAEVFFPIFKESEDEKIRKEIKQHFLFLDDLFPNKVKWITWLEKQGEQNPTNKVKPRYSIGDVLCDKSCTTLNKESQPNIEILDIKNGMYICDKCSFPISQQDEYELVAKRIEPQPSWSEEDEKMIEAALQFAHEYGRHGLWCWLKSLKDRVDCEVNCTTTKEWKPTEQQMRALRFAIKKIDTNTEVGEYRRDLLEELIEQLKKLKGE